MERMNERTRTTSPPTSGVRVSAWRALAVVACAAVALVVSFLFPCEALAADYQDVWNHQSIDGGQQYIVGAYNSYDAAAFVCGYSSSVVGGWDLPVRAKLSNAPAIVAMADSFGNVTPWNDELLRETCEQYFGSFLWSRMQDLYGGIGGIHFNSGGVNDVQLKYWQDNMPAGMHVYALNTTSEAVGAAKEAFRAILAGEDTGGGGGVVGDYLELSGNVGFSINSSNHYRLFGSYPVSGNELSYYKVMSSKMNSSGEYTWLPDLLTIRIPLSLLNGVFDGHGDEYNTWLARLSLNTSTTSKPTLRVFLVKSYTPVESTYTANGGGTYISSFTGVQDNGYGFTAKDVTGYTFDGSTITITGLQSVTTAGAINEDIGTNSGVVLFSSDVSSGGGDDPEPPNNWPDDDTNTTVAPSPPELPTPKDPTIPTEPDPDPPTYYTPPTPDPPSTDPPYEPIEPTNTTPTDYTPWLRAILLALGGISSDLATHCQHLQAQMKAQATRITQGINNQLVNLGTSINGAIGDWAKWLGECLGERFDTLTDNLYDLFHWLAEQFDFTFSGDPYDDSGIIGWLRRIYNRLGSGGDPKYYAPTILDPGSEGEEEPFDFWVWLLDRIATIFGRVLGGATDAVTTLLDGIKGKFPFSIPWDILAILGLLSGNRAIPVFTFTIPAIQGWWGEIPIRVDLTPYDSAASACRTMVLIFWALVLAMKTTWMLNDVLGGVSAGIVGRFTGRLVGTAS